RPQARRPRAGGDQVDGSDGGQVRRRALGAGLAAAAFLAAGLAPAAVARAPQPANTLTVFAAASLSEPFTELGHLLETSHQGLAVRFNFAGSQQLAAHWDPTSFGTTRCG